MATCGGAPQRGTAAAAAANLRRRTAGGGGAAAGGAGGTRLQFYTDDAPGLKISPNVVLLMSIGFIASIAILHVMGFLIVSNEKESKESKKQKSKKKKTYEADASPYESPASKTKSSKNSKKSEAVNSDAGHVSNGIDADA